MKYIIPMSALAFLVAFTPIAGEAAVTKVTKLFRVNSVQLSGKGANISAKGKVPVLIKDSLKVTGKLTVQNSIVMKAGKTVDGVDVSALGTRVASAETALTALQQRAQLPDGCDSGETVQFNGTAWVCDAPSEGGTTYTAGSGIDISEGVISSTVEPGADIPSCGNGQIPRMNGGAWACSDYSTYDRYGNFLTVAKSGAQYSSIGAAMTAIVAAGDATETNQYVVWVAPGEYSESFTLPTYVHLVGADRDAVRIIQESSSSIGYVVNMSSGYATMSHLTIIAGSSANDAIGLNIGSEASIGIRDVNLDVSAAESTISAVNYGNMAVYDSTINASASGSYSYGVDMRGSLYLDNSTIWADGATTANGINASSSSSARNITILNGSLVGTAMATNCVTIFQTGTGMEMTIRDSQITQGAYSTDQRAFHTQESSTVTFRNSRISSQDVAITHGLSSTITIAASEIEGSIGGDGAITCAQSYNGSLAELTGSCTP